MRAKFPPPPDGGLKAPKMRFADTFSAETVVLETFFPDTLKRDKGASPHKETGATT
jgi:hypothetical protein